MNIAVGHFTASAAADAAPVARDGVQGRRHFGKIPIMRCPVCDARALCRNSVEINPTFRRLDYACTNFECGMTFVASLAFDKVISPSGISTEFRPDKVKPTRPPGHEFGQMSIFDILPLTFSPAD